MASPVMHTPVLVLNATYEPIHITAVKRAIVLVLKGVARTEEENHAVVHSPSLSLRVPSVIRLLEYRRIPMQTLALSRKNILLRDRNTCQFCGSLFPAAELTLDPVVPRSHPPPPPLAPPPRGRPPPRGPPRPPPPPRKKNKGHQVCPGGPSRRG